MTNAPPTTRRERGATVAVTIDAPPSRVWLSLVQTVN
jgi:hypothetical protein